MPNIALSTAKGPVDTEGRGEEKGRGGVENEGRGVEKEGRGVEKDERGEAKEERGERNERHKYWVLQCCRGKGKPLDSERLVKWIKRSL